MSANEHYFIFQELIGSRYFADYIINFRAVEEFILYLNLHFDRDIMTYHPFHPAIVFNREVQFCNGFIAACSKAGAIRPWYIEGACVVKNDCSSFVFDK